MKKLSFFVLSFFLVFTSFTFSADMGIVQKDQFDVPDFIGYVQNEIVVKFDPSIITNMDKTTAPKGLIGIPSIDQVGILHKASSILPQFPKASKKNYRGKTIDLSGWHKIKFSKKVDVKSVIKKYKKIPGVIDAQPIGIHTLYSAFPNDPYFDRDWFWTQWHLNQADGPDVDAPEAWEIETGFDDIIVAVLDTGVRYFHKDLGGSAASYDNPDNADGNIWINWTEKYGNSNVDDDGNGYIDDWVGYDFVRDASLAYTSYSCFIGFDGEIEDCEDRDNDPRDFNGHGTHVAGIVAAITNNGYGTSSTAGGWGDGSLQANGNGVKIMPLRVCWSAANQPNKEIGLCRMDFAAEALVYAADNGARFVNASWSSDDTGSIPEAIDYFLSSNGIIFKAAGNKDNQSADYINSRTDPGIVSVAATDSDDCKAYFSTYGDWVDISAPGVDILSSYHRHVTPLYDFVQFVSGTSMASPLALSITALIWSKYPDWQIGQVIQQLYASTDNIEELSCNSNYVGKLGAGRVNAFNAVNINCVDNDEDGYFIEAVCGTTKDCDDDNPDIFPDAEEVKHDGIDQDCNGYDLTIDIISAKYFENSDNLCATAISEMGEGANLVLEGYGSMNWNVELQNWEISVENTGGNPGSVTVTGSEGSVISNITALCSDPYEGDFDSDGNVDGFELAVFTAGFGRLDCSGDCEGNFDGDGDVDGSDLAVFAVDFGRTDCPECVCTP